MNLQQEGRDRSRDRRARQQRERRHLDGRPRRPQQHREGEIRSRRRVPAASEPTASEAVSGRPSEDMISAWLTPWVRRTKSLSGRSVLQPSLVQRGQSHFSITAMKRLVDWKWLTMTMRASGLETRWANVVQLKTAYVEEMQHRLVELGFYADKIDGKAGMRTRLALGA